MVAISENAIGVDFSQVYTGGLAKPRPFKTGQTVKGDNGSLYQYAKASVAIASGNSVVNITESNGEYVATNAGGTSANASGVSLAAGSYAWFELA